MANSSKNTPKDFKSNNIFSSLFRVFLAMGKYKVAFALSIVLAAIGAITMLLGPGQVGQMSNVMQEGLASGIDMDAVNKIGGSLIIIYGICCICSLIQQRIMVTITALTCKNLRKQVGEKINKIPLSYFNFKETGDVLSLMTNDIHTLQIGLNRALPVILSCIVQFFTCLVLMFITEWHLTLWIISIVVIGLIVSAILTVKSQKYFVDKQKWLAKINGFTEENFTNQQIIRLMRAEEYVKQKFLPQAKSLYHVEWLSELFFGIMHPLMNVVANLGYILVCIVGATMAITGQISFGIIIAFILYCRLFTNPLTQIAENMIDLQSAAAASDRVFEFLDVEEMPKEYPKYNFIKNIKGRIDFKHVKFAYPDKPDKLVINDFNAHVEPGQKVAIVGHTGAGKTTLVNLIMRFYDDYGGRILIDDIDTRYISRENIHSLFGMVLQNTWLFEGTVEQNLVYNLKKISRDQIVHATKICGIYDFIMALPDGFDTVITEYTKISEGQKQLLTIVRAMLQDCPMLILDEATSSVDTRTELQVQKAMDVLCQGRTSFVIAHRLSTIKNADLILVVDKGDIVEKGTHESLLRKDGYYASLYNSQFDDS